MNIDIDSAIELLYKGEFLNENWIKNICETLKQTLLKEPNIIHINSPISVVGNLHGYIYQFYYNLFSLIIDHF